MTQVLRLINWWMEVPFAGRRKPGGWSGGGGSSLLQMLNLSCLLGIQLGDIRHAVGACSVHQLFLFYSQTYGGMYFSAHLNLDEVI